MGVERKNELARDQEHLYTMRELNQDTAGVLRKINEDNEPALITRHGRLIAAILPLAQATLESDLVDKYLKSFENYRQITGERTMEGLKSTSEMADEEGVQLPQYPDRDAYES